MPDEPQKMASDGDMDQIRAKGEPIKGFSGLSSEGIVLKVGDPLAKIKEIQAMWAAKQPFFKLVKGYIEKGTKDSAAFDLFYASDRELVIGDAICKVPTGVFTEFSPGLVCIMKEKSGYSTQGLEVKAGVIDADYRDQWFVMCRKRPVKTGFPDDQQFVLKPGMKIAQFLIIKLPDVHLVAEGDAKIHFKDGTRTGGYGSTGDLKAGI